MSPSEEKRYLDALRDLLAREEQRFFRVVDSILHHGTEKRRRWISEAEAQIRALKKRILELESHRGLVIVDTCS
ncbi:MAG: uncharacterized protein KVP18_001173 [Porospora cf. gigantea A]|uniref:uncharacterized protein n=1 Tax=Porospora cf. gigantea A TaxID=2853593 RepID=UPI003559A0DE|nr:MAG: hypothetical protein KVP18_001173 [Porospora cf. gigantea A]